MGVLSGARARSRRPVTVDATDDGAPSRTGRAAAPGTVARYRSRCRSGGPLYAESGLMREFAAACSMMCAVHPVIRAATEIGVNVGVSRPMTWYAGPEG